ncbi:MAG: M15 family peptidase, partial [Treponema sp.]|nr:M15 family peptidase [Treponema sp.]
MKKCFTITALFFLLFFNLQGQVKNSNNISPFLSSSVFCPAEIKKFFKNYPDLKYTASYDLKVKDWKISIEADLYFDRTAKPKDKKSAEFYWAGGRLLPEEELANKEKYWILQYKYENELRDPKSYTEEEVEKLKEFGSSENRKSAGGSPMFFFDFLYSAQSRVIIEDHIIKSTFLGKKTRIHERIYTPIKNVEKKILAEKEDPEIKNFIENLRSADAFYWREIAGTPRKSFHSYGIAI